MQLTVEGIPRNVRRSLEAQYPTSPYSNNFGAAESTGGSPAGDSSNLSTSTQGTTVSRKSRPYNQPIFVDLSPTGWAQGTTFSATAVAQALEFVFDAGTHPLVLMGPSGESETSAIVAGLRLVQLWTLSSIIGEATLFSTSGQSKRKLTEFIEQLQLVREDYLPTAMVQRRLSIAAAYTNLKVESTVLEGDNYQFGSHFENESGGSSSHSLLSPDSLKLLGMLPTVPITPLWWNQLIDEYDQELSLMKNISLERVPMSALKARDDAPMSELVRFDRNPPALGPKSKFTKASIAEEEDA